MTGAAMLDRGGSEPAQEWRSRTPPHLQVAVDLHRRYRPNTPLTAAIQRSLGRAWNRTQAGGVR